jgi:hypothetical protein
MSAPSKIVVVVICENRVRVDDETVRACGHWMVVTRGDELPFCHACKKQDRSWRLATEQEIAAKDRAFLRCIERTQFAPDADAHLGGLEQT